MKKGIFILSSVIGVLSFIDAEAQTKQLCTPNTSYRINAVQDVCRDVCEDNGYRRTRGWKCGSDINCDNNSACICICSDPRRDRDHDRGRESQRDQDDGKIKIPLGKDLEIQIRP